MLAASDEFLAFAFMVIVSVLAFKGVMAWRKAGMAERMQRWRVLEEALRNPATDAATRERLLVAAEAKTKHRLLGVWLEWLAANLVPRRVFGSVAWLMMIGGGLVVSFSHYHRDAEAGIVMLVLGFGILTLPHVVRELDQRAARR